MIAQQQSLKDFAAAMSNFFARTHRRPTWRERGRKEGFRVVAIKPDDARRSSRKTAEVKVPKVGWVRFRWSCPIPEEVKSFRITRDAAGRRRIAFTAIPEPITTPVTGEAVGVDRGVSVSTATRSARGTADEPGRNVRAKTGLNRSALAAGWGALVRRLEQKAPGRVVKVRPAYTSQTCNACGHRAPENRKSRAVFRCTACGHQANTDVNAARNIRDSAPGRGVAAREGPRITGSRHREPLPVLLST
ncbi:RNA-guided endonuclease InsQ/TnpB family protein [Actinomadura algeriensis]|uniref:Transposase n=1 Tax=Actinomadura algeriensis TaxID=1679523 RepID=A0ABR9JVB4_9ACTN|nr:transposase [Actinomadura algeriensis]MBE1534492.1 transposase [Actinomadura algeriensis]